MLPAHEEFLDKADKHWTPEREKKIIGEKKYPLKPSNGALLLKNIGLLNNDASMSADNVRKYIQINHLILKFEPFFLDLIKQLSSQSSIKILDCACGNSYLTFLLAWSCKNLWKTDFKIVGVDNNKKLIDKSKKIAAELGLDGCMTFECSSLDKYNWSMDSRPNAVVALHACDTATDMALAFAVKHKADFVAVAPCCQAELAQKFKEVSKTERASPLASIYSTPDFRRTIGAEITDLMRMLLMRGVGYEVTVSEFVAHQHSNKNRLLACVRRGNYFKEAIEEYEKLKNLFADQGILLEQML